MPNGPSLEKKIKRIEMKKQSTRPRASTLQITGACRTLNG
jgi:hypothetical protein